jgi:hypothetical protein
MNHHPFSRFKLREGTPRPEKARRMKRPESWVPGHNAANLCAREKSAHLSPRNGSLYLR